MTHLGKIKAGLSSGIELAQGRHIQLRTKEFIPMQIDGEPWLQRPCKIDIRLLNRYHSYVLISFDGKER